MSEEFINKSRAQSTLCALSEEFINISREQVTLHVDLQQGISLQSKGANPTGVLHPGSVSPVWFGKDECCVLKCGSQIILHKKQRAASTFYLQVYLELTCGTPHTTAYFQTVCGSEQASSRTSSLTSTSGTKGNQWRLEPTIYGVDEALKWSADVAAANPRQVHASPRRPKKWEKAGKG